MRILGADFSGGQSPSITIVGGVLHDGVLTIDTLRHCDDRLDLYAEIALRGEPLLCGLDFPFRLPQAAMKQLCVDDLSALSLRLLRSEFAEVLATQVGRYEGKCSAASLYCRETDAACTAYSGLKRVNPSLVAMLYAGSKLLSYLRRSGVMIYPLDVPAQKQVCEVYPSHTWARVGLARSTDIASFVGAFNALGLLHVVLPAEFHAVASQDTADSIVACITTAAAQHIDRIYEDWTARPSFATHAEWVVAHLEGIIVRI
ncbi:MAG: hypothetical protein SNJ83_04720 [Aggregatilineales bacterium]